MRIDVHTHFLSHTMARTLEKRSDFPYSRLVDGSYRFHCCQGLTLPMTPPAHDMQVKLSHMDETGIDVGILSLGVPGPELLGGRQADEMARLTNDLLAELIDAHPDRFWGYATLGFGDVGDSLKELDRCFSTLGFRGLQLYSNINGKPLDDLAFRPVFARMAELGRPIFIHPTVPLNRNYLTDLIPVPAVAFMFDNTLAAIRLALSGVLSAHGGAPIIIPHAGATIPYLMGRLDSMLKRAEGPDVVREPSRLLKRLYMDTVVYEPEPLEWCCSLMGADQLVLGTDHPYGDWRLPSKFVEEAPYLSASEREQIRCGNAKRLFPA
jgi:aminocarboxymuconate-semialdehyde decarboxylase